MGQAGGQAASADVPRGFQDVSPAGSKGAEAVLSKDHTTQALPC